MSKEGINTGRWGEEEGEKGLKRQVRGEDERRGADETSRGMKEKWKGDRGIQNRVIRSHVESCKYRCECT